MSEKDFFAAFLNLISHRCTVATASGFVNAPKRIFSGHAMNGNTNNAIGKINGNKTEKYL